MVLFDLSIPLWQLVIEYRLVKKNQGFKFCDKFTQGQVFINEHTGLLTPRFAIKQVSNSNYNCPQVFLPREHLRFIQVQELFSNTSIRLECFMLVFLRIFCQLKKSIEVQLRRIVVKIHVHVGYCNAEFIRRLFWVFPNIWDIFSEKCGQLLKKGYSRVPPV